MKKLGGCLGKIFLGLLLLGVLGMLFGKDDEKTSQTADSASPASSLSASSEQEQSSVTQEETSSTEVASSAEASYGIGQVVSVGDLEYTVNAKSIESNFGGEFGKTANGVYLTLNVTVTNRGKKALTVSDGFFTLLQGDVEYSTDTTAGIYANDNANFFLQELNPQSSITGNVVFDVTEEVANNPDLKLQVQSSFWGFKKVLINLN